MRGSSATCSQADGLPLVDRALDAPREVAICGALSGEQASNGGWGSYSTELDALRDLVARHARGERQCHIDRGGDAARRGRRSCRRQPARSPRLGDTSCLANIPPVPVT